MGVRSKTLLVFLLLAVVIGGYTLTVDNTSLFKGQILDGGDEESSELPDLTATLEVQAPEIQEGNLVATVTIKNIGEGAMTGGKSFTYTLSINGDEVFSNSDSYSELNPGDAFEFAYPIPKSIYNYPKSGEITFVVDTSNTIKEENEENNEISLSYSY